MPLCVTLDQTGAVVAATQQEMPAECASVLLSGAEFGALLNPDFATFGITPEAVLFVAGWGFSSVVAGWVLGLVAGWTRRAIDRA